MGVAQIVAAPMEVPGQAAGAGQARGSGGRPGGGQGQETGECQLPLHEAVQLPM